jgi:hypothetical protein
MNTKPFYRVCNPLTEQGLWYDFQGQFTGLIHDWFKFCQNHELRMDYDPEICGYLSAVESLEDLYKWFSVEDIKKLQEHGWAIHEYQASNYKFYERFQHPIICQKTSILTKRIILL